jgi:methylmalonyl-CoA mutase
VFPLNELKVSLISGADPKSIAPSQTDTPRNKIRFVTAASIFDGHDVSINVIRRLLQRAGAEVIHLGHNRSAQEIVNTAIQEDVQAVAVSSYQGGHDEFYRYLVDLLHKRGATHIKVFGGGGGVITPNEAHALEEYGVAKIYTPEDGRLMGMQGIINDMLETADFSHTPMSPKHLSTQNVDLVARLITQIELREIPRSGVEWQTQKSVSINTDSDFSWFTHVVRERQANEPNAPVIGITGTGGAAKTLCVTCVLRTDTIGISPMTSQTKGSLSSVPLQAGSTMRESMRSISLYLVAWKNILIDHSNPQFKYQKGHSMEIEAQSSRQSGFATSARL